MEHSTAIMQEAGDAIEAAARSAPSPEDQDKPRQREDANDEGPGHNSYDRRKRKGAFADTTLRHGSQRGAKREGSGGGDRVNKRHKRSDMGRAEYFRDAPDKRQKTNESREKRVQGDGPSYGTQFSKEEIDAEERRPKRKVAVLIGYSGTGYKGMQISPSEKTIEGDLFNAFVAAGAISKANADDPKKASLVRCARTDKGVHAAGNVISLKLIVEEQDIISKINANLDPQIRVWGIERTIGSFNCYQACDSRWYEYLIPSYAFLPPHPSSWLARKLEELADDAGDRAGYDSRQTEVHDFWQTVDGEVIDPILATIDAHIRGDVVKALRGEDEASAQAEPDDADSEQVIRTGSTMGRLDEDFDADEERTEDAAIIINEPSLNAVKDRQHSPIEAQEPEKSSSDHEDSMAIPTALPKNDEVSIDTKLSSAATPQPLTDDAERQVRLRTATKQIRQAYTTAKRRYRIGKQRIDRIQTALDKFVGTANYHNYTIQKTFRDPAAKRHIKSFVVNPTPVLFGGGDAVDQSEWLSLKVHGQSFMMHQIRKMIGMVALLVRCGSDLSTLDHSLTDARYSIPKVPGLGLLLERPVFDSYNNSQAEKHAREKLDFGKFEREMDEFKQREIYQRIFREEEEKNEFGKFFNHLDNFKDSHFLYVTSKGIEATKGAKEHGENGMSVTNDK